MFYSLNKTVFMCTLAGVRTPPFFQLTFFCMCSTKVTGTLAAVNDTLEDLVVQNLSTPLGVYPCVVLRRGDIVQIEVKGP